MQFLLEFKKNVSNQESQLVASFEQDLQFKLHARH